MTGITKTHETLVAPAYKNGVTIQFITLTFASDITGNLGIRNTYTGAAAQSPVVQALDAIAKIASIELIGTPITNVLPLGIAALGGAFGTADYDGDNDTETFALACQQAIVAAGTSTGALQGIANTATTVAAGIRGTAF